MIDFLTQRDHLTTISRLKSTWITIQHTWIFKRESTAFVACWLYAAIDAESVKGFSLVLWSDIIGFDIDETLLLPLLLPANKVCAHEPVLFTDDDDVAEFCIGKVWDLA